MKRLTKQQKLDLNDHCNTLPYDELMEAVYSLQQCRNTDVVGSRHIEVGRIINKFRLSLSALELTLVDIGRNNDDSV